MEHWLTDSGNIQKWYFFPNASISISYNSVASYFNFCVIYLYFQKETKSWLIRYYDLFLKGVLHIFARCSLFWFSNPCKYLLVQFSSYLLAGNTRIHVSTRADFLIFKSSVLVFCMNSVFWFLSGTYLAVDYNSVSS